MSTGHSVARTCRRPSTAWKQPGRAQRPHRGRQRVPLRLVPVERRRRRTSPFEAAREELREKFFPTWRQERFNQLAGQLSANHMIEVYSRTGYSRNPGGS